MGKYIKTSDLRAIVNGLIKDDYYGMVSYDRLIKQLLKDQFINIPHINNIDAVIELFEKAAEEIQKTSSRSAINIFPLTVVDVHDLTGISRPTLMKWFKYMNLINPLENTWRSSGYHSYYHIDSIIDFLKKVKEEQEK